MENRQHSASQYIDPVGIELALDILTIVVRVITILFSIPARWRDRVEVSDKIKVIRREILRLQNSVDNLVLILGRVSHQNHETDFTKLRPTISGTFIRLSDKDYVGWIELQHLIKQIDGGVYKVISELRELSLNEEIADFQHFALTNEADMLILGISETTFDRFVIGLRQLLKNLANELDNLMETTGETHHS